MKSTAYLKLLFLFVLLVHISCQKENIQETPSESLIEAREFPSSLEKEIQDIKENQNIISKNLGPEGGSRSSSCDDCPKLLDNGSFENVNGPVPGSLIQFNQGLVPNWISVSASPTILNQSGFPNLNYTLPPGYDLNNVCMMGVAANNLNPNGYWNEAVANAVQIYGDYDLEYCLEFKHFAVDHETGFNIQPSKIIAYISSDIPAYIGPDSQSEFLITDHSYKEVGSIYTSSGTWDQFETSFTSTKDYNQLTFVPYFQDQVLPSGARAFTHIDDVQLYCHTDALVDIDYTFLPNSLSLSPVFDGLPPNVNIDSYTWIVTNVTQQISYQSLDANPTIDLAYSSTDGFEVCLSITDSRNCCAEFCKYIFPPKCNKNTFTINLDDIVYDNDNDGTYEQKRISALALQACGGPILELWGMQGSGELGCGELYLFQENYCSPMPIYSNPCDPNDLLALGQSRLSAICPGATLSLSNNSKTWTLTLPENNSCEILGLRVFTDNREHDSNCNYLGSESQSVLAKEWCQCS